MLIFIDETGDHNLQKIDSEKGLNAKIVDQLVWQKVSNLMSSPELLSKQVERWLNSKKAGSQTSTINLAETEKEIVRLKDREDRYAKAYGLGVITVNQLKEYTLPIKEKISLLDNQIKQARVEIEVSNEAPLPKKDEIEIFAQKASQKLQSLSFISKQEIVRNVVDKVVGTREELQVYGYIPITPNINVFPIHRHCRASKRRQIDAFQRAHQKERARCKLSVCHH